MHTILSFFYNNPSTPQPEQPNEEGNLQGRRVTQQPQDTAIEVAAERLEQRHRLDSNYDLIMGLKKSDMDHLAAENGQLVIKQQQTSPEDKKRAIALIQQTYRQTWGRLVDAHFGHTTHAEAMLQINRLKDHLVRICPEGIPQGQLQGTQSQVENNETKNLYLLERGLPKLSAEEEDERYQKVTELAQNHLNYSSMKGTGKEGIHATELVKETTNGTSLGIRKEEEDRWVVEKYPDLVSRHEQKEFAFLGGFNETLASLLNILLGGRLGIALAVHRGNQTHHAFADHQENLKEFAKREGVDSLPLEASQRFVFAQLITRNADAHGGNILVTLLGELIPIDFARILTPNPIQGSYFTLPCLDQPINPEDREFYANLDVAGTVETLRNILLERYPERFENEKSLTIINFELNMLKARLYMVQIGAQKNMTQRQLMALDLPPLSEATAQTYKKFNELMPLNKDQKISALGFAKTSNGNNLPSFNELFNASFTLWNGAFDDATFKTKISEGLDKIARVPPNTLYTQREATIYRDIGHNKGLAVPEPDPHVPEEPAAPQHLYTQPLGNASSSQNDVPNHYIPPVDNRG